MSFASDAKILRRVAQELSSACDEAETSGDTVDRSLRADIQALLLIAHRFDSAVVVTQGIPATGPVSDEMETRP